MGRYKNIKGNGVRTEAGKGTLKVVRCRVGQWEARFPLACLYLFALFILLVPIVNNRLEGGGKREAREGLKQQQKENAIWET